MANLNPAFENQGATPLPVAFGYVNGSGNQKLNVTDPYNNQFACYLLGDGEWDGYEQYSPSPLGPLLTIDPNRVVLTVGGYSLEELMHFHTGRWTPIGAPTSANSIGPENAVDKWFTEIPTVTPAQSLSGIAHAWVQFPYPTHTPRGVTLSPPAISLYGVFRGSRCRYFDSAGNVVGYGFTTNPTWHIIEALLRYKFKRQQPQVAGLTPAERACFNWPSIVAHAARNDFILSNGWPRFMGNYIFASNATLASMLETMLRCCRSYIDDPDGQIGLYGYDATNSGFALNANHIVPGTFKAEQRDLTKAPNVFVPKYRDLNIAALISVTSMDIDNAGRTVGSASVPSGGWAAYFNTGGVDPFVAARDILYYGDGSNAAMNGDFYVGWNPDPTLPIPGIWCYVPLTMESAATSTGGYIGTQTSRFGQRAPRTVQHRRHQKSVGAPAPGVTAQPTITPVEYDLGNCTYDQANRIMQWMCNTQLGIDQAGWTGIITGSGKVRLDAVDANGNAFIRMRPKEGNRGDGCGWGRFTTDDTIDTLPAGDWILTKHTINPPSDQDKLGSIDIEFIEYVGTAGYPDTSPAPDDSLRTIASAALPQLGRSNNLSNVAWLLQSTPSSALSGGTVTVTIPDLTLWLLGAVASTGSLAASWTGLTPGTQYLLYVDNPTSITPTFGALTGVSELPVGSASTRYKVLAGKFDGTTDFTTTPTYTQQLSTE